MDSTTTSWPDCRIPPSARTAEISGPRSGSRLAVSGVGTQIRTASHRASGCDGVVASIRPRPPATARTGCPRCRTSPRGRCRPCARPCRAPITSWPASANATASGRPDISKAHNSDRHSAASVSIRPADGAFSRARPPERSATLNGRPGVRRSRQARLRRPTCVSAPPLRRPCPRRPNPAPYPTSTRARTCRRCRGAACSAPSSRSRTTTARWTGWTRSSAGVSARASPPPPCTS